MKGQSNVGGLVGWFRAMGNPAPVNDNIIQSCYSSAHVHAGNNAGGIEGGMSNGEPVILRAAMKPISTLAQPLSSIDIVSKKPVKAMKEAGMAIERMDQSQMAIYFYRSYTLWKRNQGLVW